MVMTSTIEVIRVNVREGGGTVWCYSKEKVDPPRRIWSYNVSEERWEI